MGEDLSRQRRSGASPPSGVAAQTQGAPLALHVQALGVPEARLGDIPLRFPTKKTLALLIYLAVTGAPQPREQLAALFWPDREDERARATLRSTLRLLRQTLADAVANTLSAAPDATSEPLDPGQSSKRNMSPQPIDLFLRSGHDRLGRDSLWLERSSGPHLPASPARVAGMARAVEQASAGPEAVVSFDLDLDTLERAAPLAARWSAQISKTPSAYTETLDVERSADGEDDAHLIQRLASAVAVCRGSFLAEFNLDDSDGFTEWVAQQRAYWQRRMDSVFDALSHAHLQRGAFTAALDIAGRWVELNALAEAGYRRLMEAHAAAGDRTAALAAYARCRETLANALGVEPAPETVALAERIRHQATSSVGLEGASADVRPQSTRTSAPRSRPALPHMHPLGDPMTLALPLAGREVEFAALVAACERARQGSASVVALAGAAGIGKTRLATEFLHWVIQTRGAEVLWGQALEAGGRMPYQPLVEALRTRLERERAPDDLLDDVWLVELSRLLPELRERYPDLAMPAGNDSVAAERLFEAVAHLGLALSHRLRASGNGVPVAPLVLFLDDAQWSDVGTRDLVRFVVRRWREAGAPLLLLLTMRREDLSTSGELREWLAELTREVGETGMSIIPLRALGADTLLRLLQELAVEDAGNLKDLKEMNASARGDAQTGDDLSIGQAPPVSSSLLTSSLSEAAPQATSQTVAQLAQWLHAETRGQPLYLVQMLRALLEQGALAWTERDEARPGAAATVQRSNARWQLRVRLSPQEIANLGELLPASMRAVIQQRLERLSPSTRQFLMAGAALGTRFRPEQAWAIADLDETSGLDALEEAERRLVIHAESSDGSGGGDAAFGDDIYRFTHDKLREVIYTETGAMRRRVLHRRAYEFLASVRATPAELVRHALLAGLHEPAFHTSITAGDAALAVYAVRDAISHYEQAQRLLTEGWDREPAPPLTEARERLYAQLGRAYEWIGAWDEALRAYQALCLLVRERGDRIAEATALLRLAVTSWHAYDMTSAQAWASEALAVVQTTGDVALQAEAEWTVGQVETIAGEVASALPHARHAVDLARAANLPELVARGLVRLAMTHLLLGSWDEAGLTASDAHERYAELAQKALGEQALALTGPTRAATNSVSQTQETAARWAFGGSLPATATAYRAMEATALSFQAFGEICGGDLQVGVEVGRTAHQLARAYESVYARLYSGSILSVGLVEAGAYEEGLLVARQGLDAARANGDPILTLHALSSVAYVRHALLCIEDARVALEEALALIEQVGAPDWRRARPLSYLCATHALADDWLRASEIALKVTELRKTLHARLLYFDFMRQYETESLLRAGEVERAKADIAFLAERLRPERQDRRYQLVLLRMRAALARHEGRRAEAIAHLEAALRLAGEIGLPGEQWRLLAELAGLREASGDEPRAASAQAQAESIVATLAANIADQQLRATYLRAASQALRALVN